MPAAVELRKSSFFALPPRTSLAYSPGNRISIHREFNAEYFGTGLALILRSMRKFRRSLLLSSRGMPSSASPSIRLCLLLYLLVSAVALVCLLFCCYRSCVCCCWFPTYCCLCLLLYLLSVALLLYCFTIILLVSAVALVCLLFLVLLPLFVAPFSHVLLFASATISLLLECCFASPSINFVCYIAFACLCFVLVCLLLSTYVCLCNCSPGMCVRSYSYMGVRLIYLLCLQELVYAQNRLLYTSYRFVLYPYFRLSPRTVRGWRRSPHAVCARGRRWPLQIFHYLTFTTLLWLLLGLVLPKRSWLTAC